jgi:transcriptional regulator with XRE-family HTH domain
MKHRAAGNYLRAHRKKSGLSQREVGNLLGYKDPGQISRHERATSIPPLATALAYELIFRAPVAGIFTGIRDAIVRDVEEKLKEMGLTLENRNAGDRNANLTAQKLAWLTERQRAQARN